MKITAIQRQVTQVGRYSIFIDGAYVLSMSDAALLEQKLVPGQTVTEAEVMALKEVAETDKLYGLTLRYATLRMRSVWEVQTYLARKHCPPALTKKILNKLSGIGILDDLAFSHTWVENRKLLKPSSRRKIILELRTKHVDESVINQVLTDDNLSDRESLHALVAKKRRMTQYQDDTKLMAYLARQGFNYDDIRTVLKGSEDD